MDKIFKEMFLYEKEVTSRLGDIDFLILVEDMLHKYDESEVMTREKAEQSFKRVLDAFYQAE